MRPDHTSHATDQLQGITWAMDLTPLVENPELPIAGFHAAVPRALPAGRRGAAGEVRLRFPAVSADVLVLGHGIAGAVVACDAEAAPAWPWRSLMQALRLQPLGWVRG
jgi:hypothetical protein